MLPNLWQQTSRFHIWSPNTVCRIRETPAEGGGLIFNDDYNSWIWTNRLQQIVGSKAQACKSPWWSYISCSVINTPIHLCEFSKQWLALLEACFHLDSAQTLHCFLHTREKCFSLRPFLFYLKCPMHNARSLNKWFFQLNVKELVNLYRALTSGNTNGETCLITKYLCWTLLMLLCLRGANHQWKACGKFPCRVETVIAYVE